MNNKKIVSVLTMFSILFLSLVFYLTYIGVQYHETYIQSNYNQRNALLETKILRGTIYDRNGTVLAYSETIDGMQTRKYPYDNMYSHVIGYSSPQFGKSLIEKQYNQELLNQSNIKSILSLDGFEQSMSEGNDLYLTIDHNLQQKAHELMKGYKGALVAMDPVTGEILYMVSMPDYNPNEASLSEAWSSLNSDETSPFLTRATMGLYAPGSTYKVITTASIIENGLENETVSDTEGKIHIVNKDISNSENKIYGDTDLNKAFIKSSNVYYAKLGSLIKHDVHKDIAQRFMLNKEISFDIPVAKSNFETQNLNELGCAITSIGQGSTLMTPMHMALVASTIANDGVMPKPYIVESISKDGTTISASNHETLAQPISSDIAKTIKQLMLDTVKSGTGTAAGIYGIEVCGKTGTAENEMTTTDVSKTHALFIGFAPYENPEIAVCVIMENAGFGGSVAAPVAREVMKTYFSNK